MSAPGYTNRSSSASFGQNSPANGGAAPPFQNGETGRIMVRFCLSHPLASPAPPPSSSAQYSHQPFQQTPYAPPGSYYVQQSCQTSLPQTQPQTQTQPQPQPTLVPAPAAGPGAPLYPIVSYPSAHGCSQYGTLSSLQNPSTPGVTQIAAPLHHYNTAPPPCATGVQPGYAAGSAGQTAPTVNGQGGAGTSEVLAVSIEIQLNCGETSSSTTGSASPAPNSYDSLEGGSFPGGPPSHFTKNTQVRKNVTELICAFDPLPSLQPFPNLSQLSAALGGLSGVPELEVEALRPVNLLQERNLLPQRPQEAPEPNLSPDLKKVNCSPQTFRCTLTSIPQTQALLNKARLPLGLLLHPFRDLQQLPVITSNTIVRCRSCRTYINPFVTFLDQHRWKCNLCYRVNDVPDEFMYNPVSRSYGEPHMRPEVQNSTVEFIASSDYMLRPPQPAVYLFVLDVSHNAVEAGYLKVFCDSLLENLDKMPGDSRTRVGFLTFDSTVHFYNLQEGLSQPQMLVVSDIDDVFIPSHDSLMVNLKESRELVKDLLTSLPAMFSQSRETHSALGPALQAAFKLMSPTGGRVSVFQTQLPSLGAGKLQSREDPNQRSSTKGVQHLGPATDFYKKLALDCSGQQIGVDLFLLSSQYADLASLACVSKYSAGSIFYYPSFHHVHNPAQLQKLQKDLERYFTRKIGFEAVMRIRCTKGLSIHTFHGNFFVRSTDLLSLANVNPDSAFAVQVSIEDSLADSSLACFQAALLYTSSKGKRRIRVHTLCLPVVNQLSDVYAGADVQAITCLLANMG
uniref:SEC24 homolog B, COPII coat complex component n=1 Tax=Oryzias sinensis TaxID=183150 RepID=A0A8C7V8M9_9TELE